MSPDQSRAVTSKLTWLPDETIHAFIAEDTDCYRLASSPECWVERFGSTCLVSHDAALPTSLIEDICKHSKVGPPLEAIYARKLVRGPGTADAPKMVWGEARNSDARFLAKEAGLLFEVDFSLGYSCGLFLDQRANRAHLRSFKPERVLNCFSFTCSFSVGAASVGARTTSLDLSKHSLTRGRRNFAVNGLDETGHRFLADDVFDVLPRLARRGETFDVIILDPPTFSRGRGGRVFRAETDLPALVEMALACATPSARLLISTNCSRISQGDLQKLLKKSIKIPLLIEQPEGLPDFPEESGSSTLWLSLRNRHRSHAER